MNIHELKTADDFIKHADKINPNREPLTIEKLRTFPGYENYSDEQAGEVVQTLEELAIILFEAAFQNDSSCIDNQGEEMEIF